MIPVGKIAERAVCRSVFLTICHCILNAEFTKTHSFRLSFGDFTHWENKPIYVTKIKYKDLRPAQKKNNLKECVFVNSALKIQCQIVKYTLLFTAFSAILPTGILPKNKKELKEMH